MARDYFQEALHKFNTDKKPVWYGWKTHDDNGDKIPNYQQIDQAKLVPVLTAALKAA